MTKVSSWCRSAVLLGAVILYLPGAARTQGGNPRLVPNCAGIGTIRPLGTTLPIGINYTVTITGCNFGSSTGTIHVCNSATYGGTCADALGISWSSTSVSGAIRAGALSVGATVYLYVTDASSNTNTNGLGPFTLSQAAFWVRTDGSDTNDGTANTPGKAWMTITHGVNALSAGQIVRVQPGVYSETVTPTVSGASGNLITVVAGGAVTACGFTFSGQSYVQFVGLNFDATAGSCGGGPSPIGYMHGTNTGIEFWNNTIGNLLSGKGWGITEGDPDRCNKCIFFGNDTHHIGGTPDTASVTAFNPIGDDNYVGYGLFRVICYIGVGPAGTRGRYVNLNFTGLIQCNMAGAHPDNYYINTSSAGFTHAVVESNYGNGTPTSIDNKGHHAQNDSAADWTDVVWRRNVNYNYGSAIAYSMYASTKGLLRWFFYNNTYAVGDRAQDQMDPNYNSCGNMSNQGGGGLSAWVINTIHYHCWGDGATSNIAPWAEENLGVVTIVKDYNEAFTPTGSVTFNAVWTGQAHPQSNVDPLFVNSSSDFTLQSGSTIKTAGGPVTTAVGSGSSSTSLTVATGTGSMFVGDNSANLPQYGGALVPGDFGVVGSCAFQVSSVSGDVLTLVSGCTWSNGDPVYFGTSTTPPIGAYPYKAGGYTITATKHVSAGVVTITVNDTDLVRMVVCYKGKVPYAIDTTAPYTCAIPAEPFEARVYPKYASQTRWVVAQ